MTVLPRASDRSATARLPIRQAQIAALSLASLIVVICTLAALLQALQLPFTALDDGLHWAPRTGQVLVVAPGSASEAFGLWPGDRIIALERSSVRAESEIMVLRDGHMFSRVLDPLTPSTSVLLKRYIPIGVAILIPVIGFLVWAHKPYDLTVSLFLIGCLLCATGLAAERLLLLHPRTAGLASLHATAIASLAAVIIHGHMRVTRYRPPIDERSLVISLYGIAATLAVATLPPAVLYSDAFLVADGARLYAVFALVVAVVLLAFRYRSLQSPLDRRPFTAIILFTGVTTMLLAGGTVVPDIVLGRPLLPFETMYVALGCIPLAYGLAVFRHDLLSVGRLINRRVAHSMGYVLAGAVVFFAGMLVFGTWHEVLTAPAPASVVMLCLAVCLVGLCAGARWLVDELLYRGWYDTPTLIDQVARSLNGVTEPRALADVLVSQLAPMRLRMVTLLLAGADGLHLVAERGTGMLVLTLGSLLATRLADAERPHTTEELVGDVAEVSADVNDARCLDWARRTGVEIWAPLVRDGTCYGVLLAGRRSDEEPCTAEDRKALGAIAQHVAMSAENVVTLARLRARLAEVEQLRESLEATVDERTGALARARDELERVVLARGREVSAVVHDLLHDLKNAQVLQRTLIAAARQGSVDAQLVADVGQQLENVHAAHEALLHDMLAAVLIQEGQLELHPAPVDLARLAAQVAERLQPRYTSQRCQLLVEVSGLIPLAWCDERQVARVLHNLLVNALEYTSPMVARGDVRVRLTAIADQAVIAIVDNGAGIEPAALAELQAVCAETASGRLRPHGMGIGLRFAARLIALSGGRLSIDSAGRDRGTTVAIALPQAWDERAVGERV